MFYIAIGSVAIVFTGFRDQILAAGKEEFLSKGVVTDSIQECLENIRDIKACNRQEVTLEELDRRLKASENARIHSELAIGVFVCSAQAFSRIGLAPPCWRARLDLCWSGTGFTRIWPPCNGKVITGRWQNSPRLHRAAEKASAGLWPGRRGLFYAFLEKITATFLRHLSVVKSTEQALIGKSENRKNP